jgi:hypothetical protein
MKRTLNSKGNEMKPSEEYTERAIKLAEQYFRGTISHGEMKSEMAIIAIEYKTALLHEWADA